VKKEEKEGFDVVGGWEEYARCYDAILALDPYVDMMREVVWHLLDDFKASKVLDASCGTGNFEHILSKHIAIEGGDVGQIYGIDSSKEMLARASGKMYPGLQATFGEVDLNNPLPFSSSHFDAVVSANTLYTVKDPRSTLSELFRVLRSGGRCVLTTPKNGFENGFILRSHARSTEPDSEWERVHASQEREEYLVRKAVKDNTIAEMMLRVAHYNRYIAKNCTFHFFTMEELVQLFVDVGFLVRVQSYTYAKQGLLIVAEKPTTT
jgi:ubiquinone/menaquinone biosynthesis C-methylase UbiE